MKTVKKSLALALTVIVIFGLGVVSFGETVDDWTAFKGGFVDNNYFPVTITPIDGGVKFSGKGGLNWPDGAATETSAMGGAYNKKLDLDGLSFELVLDKPLPADKGDYWHVVTIASQPKMFNAWRQDDSVKCFFIMMNYNSQEQSLNLMLHKWSGWSHISQKAIAYEQGSTIKFQIKKEDNEYALYVDNKKFVGKDLAERDVNTFDLSEILPDGKGYIVAGAHIANPDQPQYKDEYAYSIKNINVSMEYEGSTQSATSQSNPKTSDAGIIIWIATAGVCSASILSLKRKLVKR